MRNQLSSPVIHSIWPTGSLIPVFSMNYLENFLAYKARLVHNYKILCCSETPERPYPLLRDRNGALSIYSVGPEHGRSFVVGRTSNGRYIVSKGNGLSYTQYPFLNTREFGKDSWGLLLEPDARRDFAVGREIEQLGIKTSHMEYVMQLDHLTNLSDEKENPIKPVLLQYDIECPYRISDAAIMPRTAIHWEVTKWKRMNRNGRAEEYLIAADRLVENLRILHSDNILHNAIGVQNYTWALEVLDFELSSTPAYPYSNEDYERHKVQLFDREILYTYQIIVYIARVIGQVTDFKEIDKIFMDNGFDLSSYAI